MATHLRTELVLDALNMTVWQRLPEQVIHHSDQGTRYTFIAFGLRCREVGVKPSMVSVGDAYDNALCESFFATLECEFLDLQRCPTQAEAKMAVFDFIEGFYNTSEALLARPEVADRLRAAPQPRGGRVMELFTPPLRGKLLTPEPWGTERQPQCSPVH